MLDRPLILGVLQLDPSESVPLDAALAKLGQNTGNMFFSDALLNVLQDAKLSHYDLGPQVIQDRDSIVIAAANWLSTGQDFSWLADRIEETDLPVFTIGLGAQAPLNHAIPRLSAGTKRLIGILKDRSNAISVRGDFTAEVLNSYGVKSAVVTGCPSLLLAGPQGFSISAASDLSDETVCLHGTRHHFNGADVFQNFIFRQAFEREIDLILQSELADMYFATGRTNNSEMLERASGPLIASYGHPDIADIGRYLKAHGKLFFDRRSWTEYLSSRSFCLGTRIHGTVAALLAGVPATLIAHDSRTRELAETMNIPFVVSSSINIEEKLDPHEFYDLEKIQTFTKGYSTYRQRFFEFFAQNDLVPNSNEN